jgi:D-hydroxyproline dehydrogenase subunit beta
MKSFDVAIVGAGIVGAACAASLSSAGLSVLVVDEKGIGAGSTSAGMGHIVVMDDSEAQFALTRYSQQLWNELLSELPSSAEFDNGGTIWVAADEEEMDEVKRKHKYYYHRGVSTEILDDKALIIAEPNLRRGLAGGLLVPGDSTVYQLGATSYLIEKAVARGARVIVGTKAVEISDNGVRLLNGQFLAAGATINAAGAAAPVLSPSLNIIKRKGHLVITERYPNFARHQIVELGYLRSAHGNNADSVAFNVQPRTTGQVILGSSRQFGVEHGEIDRDILRRMTARAFEYMPSLRGLSTLRIWTGFRPATPDNLPYIGRLPGNNNIYIAAGHEGLGITTSLGTGELIADTLLGRETAIPIEPYSPGREVKEH